MNNVVIMLIFAIFWMAVIIHVEFKKIKTLQERNKGLKASFLEAQRSIAVLVRHQKEIAEIKLAEGETLNQLAEAKTDEEIFDIVNTVLCPTLSKL